MTATDNPFFETWTTPFGAPPFARIKPEHFMPAYERAFAEHEAEIATIAGQKEPPTFDNTIVALENAGRALQRVDDVFGQLCRHRQQRHAAGDRARHLAPHRGALEQGADERRPVRAHRRALSEARQPRPHRRAEARAGAPSHQVPPRGRRARRRTRRSASPPSSSGWRRSAPRSARTCWPTSSPTRWSSTARPISPACPISSAKRRPPRPPSAA